MPGWLGAAAEQSAKVMPPLWQYFWRLPRTPSSGPQIKRRDMLGAPAATAFDMGRLEA
jgi:hypothetical protein